MKRAIATLKSVSPYSQGKAIATPKPPDESHDAFENRIWRERLHVNAKGEVFIPPQQFKKSVSEAAKYKSAKIPGKRGGTYTKHFKSGLMVLEPLPIGLHVDDVQMERLFVPADGKVGGGSRVFRNFPLIPEWGGDVEFLILDEIITEDVFRDTLITAGMFIGLGRYRPSCDAAGHYGRFELVGLKWFA